MVCSVGLNAHAGFVNFFHHPMLQICPSEFPVPGEFQENTEMTISLHQYPENGAKSMFIVAFRSQFAAA